MHTSFCSPGQEVGRAKGPRGGYERSSLSVREARRIVPSAL